MAKPIVRDGGPAPVPPQEGSTPKPALTPDQLRRVLEAIAGVADSADSVLTDLCQCLGTESAHAFAVVHLLRHIGALADYALDHDCKGDLAAWSVGYLFHEKGASHA